MRLTFKYRLYPTAPQSTFLTAQLKDACDLYNAAKQQRDDAWKTSRKSLSYLDQAAELKAMRGDGCVTLANFSCCQDVLRRVNKTYAAYFLRVRRGEKPGFPRYRSFRRYDSITFPSYGNGCRLLPDGKLRVQGAGHIKVKLHRPLVGEVKTVTIKREAGRWFACFSVERDRKPLAPSAAETGIDVGLNSFAVLADGTEIPNPRRYRKGQAKLRCAQRKVARRKKGGHRRRKAVQLLQRAHAHVRNQRADFHHKESRELVNEYGLIAVEDLNVKGLASGMVKVDPRGTSQTCLCGARVEKTLGDRWHSCPACGLSASRDRVSAQVILQRARNGPSGANVEVVNSCVA
jgi:putative transposase